MTAKFNAQWGEYRAWRRDFCFLLRLFSKWLKDNALMDSVARDHITRLEQCAQNEKIRVAFVAAHSSGKSELINALLFSEFGRRIMPSSAGSVTACPAEIGYQPDMEPCMLLLPIHTRSNSGAMPDIRGERDAWTHISLDVSNAAQIASSLARLTETVEVTAQEALALGFRHAQALQEQKAVDAQCIVRIPKWHYAHINIAHPLLKRGLVILDIPRLNAVGAEPVSTTDLLVQAQARLFILSADTGVIESDLAIWREHLEPYLRRSIPPLVVLNKIDTFWNDLNSPEQTERQIHAQIVRTAKGLGIETDEILAVSAQMGFLAKVRNQPDLLEKSRLQQFEQALTAGVLVQCQRSTREELRKGISELKGSLYKAIDARARELEAQRTELESLRLKSREVLRVIGERTTREQCRFAEVRTRIAAIKSEYQTLYSNIVEQLRPEELVREMQVLADALGGRGFKWDAKKIYSDTFERVQYRARTLVVKTNELQRFEASAFAQLKAEYGIVLRPVAPPNSSSYQMDLELIKRSHLTDIGIGHLLRMRRAEFVSQTVRAIFLRLQAVQSATRAQAENWWSSAMAQLDAQTELKQANYHRQLETGQKIERATVAMDQRTSSIRDSEQSVHTLRHKLSAQLEHLWMADDEPVCVSRTAKAPEQTPRINLH